MLIGPEELGLFASGFTVKSGIWMLQKTQVHGSDTCHMIPGEDQASYPGPPMTSLNLRRLSASENRAPTEIVPRSETE